MSTNNNYKGYSFFNEEKNPVLQTWQRLHMAININERHGEDDANVYLASLGDRGKQSALAMACWISAAGRDVVLKSITGGV